MKPVHPTGVLSTRKQLLERILPERFLGKEFPAPSLTVFVVLQTLDVLTTLIGLRVGAQEASLFVGQLMNIGPVPGLLLSKILGVALVALALKFRRTRVIVFLNYWFAVVVTWNLFTIIWVGLHARP